MQLNLRGLCYLWAQPIAVIASEGITLKDEEGRATLGICFVGDFLDGR